MRKLIAVLLLASAATTGWTLADAYTSKHSNSAPKDTPLICTFLPFLCAP